MTAPLPRVAACPEWCELDPGHPWEEQSMGLNFRRHRRTFGTVVVESEEDDEFNQVQLGPLGSRVPDNPEAAMPAGWLRQVIDDAHRAASWMEAQR